MVIVRVSVRVIFLVVFFFVFIFHIDFFILYFPYCIQSLDSEITLTMQNIDVTHKTTEQLRYGKRELETKLQQTIEDKKLI